MRDWYICSLENVQAELCSAKRGEAANSSVGDEAEATHQTGFVRTAIVEKTVMHADKI